MHTNNHITAAPSPENIIAGWIASHEEELIQTAGYIFRHPETAYKETLSSGYLADFLERQGFRIDKKTAGLDTGRGKTNPWISCRIRRIAGVGPRLRAQSAWDRRCRRCLRAESGYGKPGHPWNYPGLWMPGRRDHVRQDRHE